MSSSNSGNDNWGKLLSDFGIKDEVQETVQSVESKVVVQTASSQPIDQQQDNFGAGLAVPAPPAPIKPEPEKIKQDQDDSSKSKEKRSIFSRFPKINFFGTPPQVSLEDVVEGVKSPSLGKKSFTDNKLEKMPISPERANRKEPCAAQPEPAVTGEPNSWSVVASQIDVLASPERTAKRGTVSSMFDEPVPESEELRALKNLIGEQTSTNCRADFLEDEETESKRRERNRRQTAPERETQRGGRGSRYQQPPVIKTEIDDVSEENFEFEPVDDVPDSRTRGRRGARYTGGRREEQNEVPQEEWSEVDAVLQEEGARRGSRHQKFDKRQRPMERGEKPNVDEENLEEDSGVMVVHQNIPSWDDAVGDLISGNIARHRNNYHQSRGRR